MNTCTNAMDNIEVRPLRFDVENITGKDPVWSYTHPLFSIYINAFGVHIPYFERFLCMAFREGKDLIDDPQLKADISAIIGQEAHHAHNFIHFNQILISRYKQLKSIDAHAKGHFEKALSKQSLKQKLGFVAGYETFTYLAGMIVLEGYEKWFKEADPVVRSMWVWHQIEEIEHGSVAFNVYRALYGKYEWYRKWKVVQALSHIAWEALKAYVPMCHVEGYFKTPLKAARAVGFFIYFTGALLKSGLPVLRKGYHPRNHPLCSTKQNPIAVAWRKYYSSGKDSTAISTDKLKNFAMPSN